MAQRRKGRGGGGQVEGVHGEGSVWRSRRGGGPWGAGRQTQSSAASSRRTLWVLVCVHRSQPKTHTGRPLFACQPAPVQSVQFVAPDRLNCPAEQGVPADAPATQKLPAGQAKAVAEKLPAGQKYPGLHCPLQLGVDRALEAPKYPGLIVAHKHTQRQEATQPTQPRSLALAPVAVRVHTHAASRSLMHAHAASYCEQNCSQSRRARPQSLLLSCTTLASQGRESVTAALHQGTG